jgi:hypothetical protein
VTQAHAQAGLWGLDATAAGAQPRSKRLGRHHGRRLGGVAQYRASALAQREVGKLVTNLGEVAHQLEHRPGALAGLDDVRDHSIVLDGAHEMQGLVVAQSEAWLVGAHRAAADAGPHREASRSVHHVPG